ncbi:HET-domain-containing protein [Jackrogersella minutella]|nr:HET-domain-containing protein [Jackrogersella minutella]
MMPQAGTKMEDMEQHIYQESIQCIESLGDHKFLPKDQIECLATKDNIKKVLMESDILSPSEELLDFIVSKAKKVFLTLVYINKVDAIQYLQQDGLCDEHLPLVIRDKIIKSLYNNTHDSAPSRWRTFEGWKPPTLEYFCSEQWRFLAPVFKAGILEHHRFEEKHPLPFVKKMKTAGRGRFGEVYQVKIHNAHIGDGFPKDGVVAVKRFKSPDPNAFLKELQILRDLATLIPEGHNHLITAFAAYDNTRDKCVLFPWCEGGTLLDYWQEHDSEIRDEKLISWTLSQMTGLCHCLKVLWSNNFRHGDLKPRNILYKGGEGNFLFADVGVSKIHQYVTEERPNSTTARYADHQHAAPEFTANKEPHQPLSRDYDTWSMGAILLEWLLWLIDGRKGLKELTDVKKFWDLSMEGKPVVNNSVQRCMGALKNRMDTGSPDNALRHLLTLIETRLLIVELAKGQSPKESGRAKATELYDSMDEIMKQTKQCSSFTFDARIWRDNTVTTMTLPERQRQDNDSNLDKRRLFGNVLDQHSTMHLPDTYDENGKQVDDVWKSQPDNDYARQISKQLGWAFHKTPSPLCDSCRALDVFSPSFQLNYNMSDMEISSKTCSFCALLRQCLKDNDLENIHVGKITRENSTLKEHKTGVPLISIYSGFESHPTALNCAQLGSPELPEPGSLAQSMLLREWLRNCDEYHKCRPAHSLTGGPKVPTRLLDVGSGSTSTLRLVDTNDQANDRYVALSHCWGNIPEEQRFCTYRSNIEKHKQGIELDKLPDTLRDAVKVTQSLGIRYLWVDSICIIQKDVVDWETQAGNMETVFSSAYCTIAASSAVSSRDGFICHRDKRAYITMDKDGSILYMCKYIDNFHRDVEEAALNKRGWVLQERALSRRTVHFTSNQIYWECGNGVHCETLAKLHNSKAAFLGDADFPNSALRYFREGRIVLFQTLYGMYSKLAFSEPTDRSMGVIGLERRLARTFQTIGDYGVLMCYLCRSLMWKREGNEKLRAIVYPNNRTVPSWSWMAYSGGISYFDAPFGGVDWKTDNLEIPCQQDGRFRNSTQTRAGKPDPEIITSAMGINMDVHGEEILSRLTFDEVDVADHSNLRCVVLGKDKGGGQGEDKYYVMVIKPCSADCLGVYTRVGVGSLLERHILFLSEKGVCIR